MAQQLIPKVTFSCTLMCIYAKKTNDITCHALVGYNFLF